MTILDAAFSAAREAYTGVARTPGPNGNYYDALQAAIDALRAKQVEILAVETCDGHPRSEQIADMKVRQAEINVAHGGAGRGR
jgi:hypothetical protein